MNLTLCLQEGNNCRIVVNNPSFLPPMASIVSLKLLCFGSPAVDLHSTINIVSSSAAKISIC